MRGQPLHVNRRRRARLHRLRTLGYRSYAEYLRSPHWRETKVRYRASDRPQACICGETDGLQIHHLTYERIGAEQLEDLIALCAGCHQALHVLERRGDMSLDPAELVSAPRAAAYAAATPLSPRDLLAELRAERAAVTDALGRYIAGRMDGHPIPPSVQTDLAAIGRAWDRIEAKFAARC